MNEKSQWHRVLRLAWSTGGIVGVNQPGPEVQVRAGIGGKVIDTAHLDSYERLFWTLEERGYPVLGATFVN